MKRSSSWSLYQQGLRTPIFALVEPFCLSCSRRAKSIRTGNKWPKWVHFVLPFATCSEIHSLVSDCVLPKTGGRCWLLVEEGAAVCLWDYPKSARASDVHSCFLKSKSKVSFTPSPAIFNSWESNILKTSWNLNSKNPNQVKKSTRKRVNKKNEYRQMGRVRTRVRSTSVSRVR